MRHFVLFLSLPLAACALPTRVTMYGTPDGVDPTFRGVEAGVVDYEILGSVSGQHCGDLQEYLLASGGRPNWTGPVHPQIMEAARFDALQKLPEADSLMYVRAKVDNDGYKQCVTITGRAYRVLRMSAGNGSSGSVAPDAPPAPPTPPVAAPVVVPVP